MTEIRSGPSARGGGSQAPDFATPLHQGAISVGRHVQHPDAPGLSARQRKALDELWTVWHRLATYLIESTELAGARAIGITSPVPGEGKTTACIGLASALALESGGPVALVETDFARPALAADFGVDWAPGLADYLLGRCPLHSALKETGTPGLVVVPAATTERPEVLASRLRRCLPELLSGLRKSFAHIVMDLPSLLGEAATVGMARHVDEVMLVVRAGGTALRQLEEAAHLLADRRLLGVVYLGPTTYVPRWLSGLVTG